LTKAMERLAQLPRGFALAPDSDKLGGNVRQIIYGKGGGAYRILYRVIEPRDGDPGIVSIVRVRHAAQRLLGEADDEQD
jgi:plasmid stabilization system protein ParE